MRPLIPAGSSSSFRGFWAAAAACGDDEEVDEYEEAGIKVEEDNDGDVMQKKVVMMKPLGCTIEADRLSAGSC